MRSRPPIVTVAAILLVLLSLSDFPWISIYQLYVFSVGEQVIHRLGVPFLFPMTVEPPAFILYSGYVLGIVGLVVAIGLWMLKKWSFWAAIIVCVLNFLFGLPGLLFAPGAALKAVIALTEVVAVLVIVLVMLPASRRALAAAEQPSSRVR
jgi:hypothetical protein